MAAKKKKTARKKKLPEKAVSPKEPLNKGMFQKWFPALVFIFAFILYANTLGHDYAQDDAIVILDNMYTQQGVEGIPGILTKDTFFGFFKEEGKAKLVSGGRYRPFTLIMFALEWELFGKNPTVSHFINVMLYGFLGVLIYFLLLRLFKDHEKVLPVFAVASLSALIYIAHPIHTEAVANIKGRDEIMSMLGSVAALWALLVYNDTQKKSFLLWSFLFFFIALMSKENAITFLAIVPISLILFRGNSLVQSIKSSWPLWLASVLFLGIRFSVLGFDFGGTPNELMNNPFLKLSGTGYVAFSFAEKMATILFTLLKYLQLMVFPHPLSHDYYPRAIEIMNFSDWQVWLSIFIHIALVWAAVKRWKSDPLSSFGILFYLISLSIVSNIVFPIGTNMSERFLFMPSLGLILVMSGLIIQNLKPSRLWMISSLVIILLLSYKTIDRNKVWKDDFTLFTSDVREDTRSAKLLNAAGGALTTNAATMAESPQRTSDLRQAIQYLEKAVSIHPGYRNAYLLLGNAHYYLGEYEKSIAYFDKSLQLDPNFKDALQNLPIVLRDGGRHMGQKMNNFKRAEEWLVRSYSMNPQDYETCRLLGITYGIQGQDYKAIEYFQKAISLRPDIAANYSSLGTAYMNIGDQESARQAFNKAVEIDPRALDHLRNQ